MRLFLYGISSFFYWLNAREPPCDSDRVNTKSFVNCEPTRETLQHLAIRLPMLPKPYHVSIPSYHQRPVENSVRHQCGEQPRGKAFIRIADGIFASSPELCFVQLANELSFHELIRAGSVLCSNFRLDTLADGALESRSSLTTKKRIASFIRANPGLRGVKHARQAIPHVVEKAASPPEVFLALVLELPFRYGGFQVENLVANRRFQLTQKAQTLSGRRTLVPDLLILADRLAIEYDSTAEHATATQLTRDARKRLALEKDGYKVITVTAKQLANRVEMRRIAEQIYQHQNRRLRPQSKAFEAQQQRLFNMGWTLNAK